MFIFTSEKELWCKECNVGATFITVQYQAAEMGLDNKSMATMSKAELAMRADDSMLVGEWAKKKNNGKVSY